MRRVVLLALLASACSADPPAETDGGTMPVDARGSVDAPMAADAPVTMPDGGGCGADQHDCSGVCTDDGLNDPATGCRLGCGDACPGGTMAICNADGTCGLRSCTAMRCEDMPAIECGLVDDGCGRRINCGMCDEAAGQRCESNVCTCMPDDNEPNESRSGLTSIASLNDFDDPPPVPLDGTIHEAGDEDWYQFTIVDGGAGGNPVIRVELEGVPAGSDYAISAYFDCSDATGANNLTSCTEGANDDTVEQGCTGTGGVDRVILSTECDWTTDESGTLWVRVRAATWGGTCGGYTARVTVT